MSRLIGEAPIRRFAGRSAQTGAAGRDPSSWAAEA